MASLKQYYIVLLVIAFFSQCLCFSVQPKAGCSIAVNTDLLEPQPLLLKPEGGVDASSAFYLPTLGSDVISINEQAIINLACPGSTVLQDGSDSGQETIDITCISGKTFDYNGNAVDFSTINCGRYPVHTARYSGASCLSQYREVEVGFEVVSRFIKHISICFDDAAQNSLYAEFDLTATIAGYQSGFPRPDFIEGDFYNTGSDSVDDLYTRNGQRATINSLLGLDAGDFEYIHDTDDYFLARGHLAAKSDFVFGSQHRLTFYYVNVAPQWQTFNGGNWNTLEQDVRDFSSSRELDLVVYTGGYGLTTLPDTNGNDQELYLYVDGSSRGLPVPKIFWKIAYDPVNRAGVALIGVNNPYTGTPADLSFCSNVCSQINWLSWQPDDQKMGYSACCDVNDFRATVNNIPDFPVDSLLV